jgi:uncharacterized coiled-coil DUF342 family protein
MNGVKNGLLLMGLFCISACYAITIQEVKMLKSNNFFGGWSQFLDQVLATRQYPISPENEAVYTAFMQQGKKLNIQKITGNSGSIADMQKQMDVIKKRMRDEKSLFDEFFQFCDSVLSEKQYPLPPEKEEAYKGFMQRAKDLNVPQSRLDEMQKKMDETNEKLSKEIAESDPNVQRERLKELQNKVDEISEKLNKESVAKDEPSKEVKTETSK